MDPKFLAVPHAPNYLFGYRQSTLERNYKFRIHMVPPALPIGDLMDPLGGEQWARSVLPDDRDLRLVRKDGGDNAAGTANKHYAENEDKAWMVRTSYIGLSTYTAPSASAASAAAAAAADEEVQEVPAPAPSPLEAKQMKIDRILKQFEDCQRQALVAPPSAGATVVRSMPLVPGRLAALLLHVVKFAGDEKLEEGTAKDDAWSTSRALMVRRPEPQLPEKRRESKVRAPKRYNPYEPLCLYLPKKVRGGQAASGEAATSRAAAGAAAATAEKEKQVEEDDEDDIFAADDDEDEDKVAAAVDPLEGGNYVTSADGNVYDPSTVAYQRDYAVRPSRERGQRLALVFGEDRVEFAPLDPDVLLLSRSRASEKEMEVTESRVPVAPRPLTSEETEERERRAGVYEFAWSS